MQRNVDISCRRSLNHNGVLRTMKANYSIDAGDVRVIRPLIYVRESATRDFAKSSHLPIINENCPACFEEPKERARVKKILQQEEAMVPALFYNLRKALLPLMHEKAYGSFKEIEAEVNKNGTARVVVKRSRKNSDKSINNADVYQTDQGTEDDHGTKKPKNENISSTCDDGYCVPCFEIL